MTRPSIRLACAALVAVALAPIGGDAGAQPPRAARRAPRGAPRARAAETTIAITHAVVRPGNAAAIADGTIVIRGERIVAVGAGLAVPAGATVIDASGMVVTPGLVATMTTLGLHEIELEDSTGDAMLEGESADEDAIRAAFSAADGYNPLSTLIPVARLGGVTSALSVPEGGLVPGTSAWVDLAGRAPADAIVREVVALHVSLNDEGVAAAGGARPSAIVRLRELLDDARLYARQRAAFDRRQFRETGDVSRLDLERVVSALAGTIPVVVKVSRASDILRTIALAEEYGLRLVISGAEEGWMVAAEIAAADVPVIVQAMSNLPTRFSTLHARYDNAALLARAGARVILHSPGAWDVRNLRQEAGNAVAVGMDADAALAAITSVPAEVFGMGTDYGVIAPGRLASLAIWSGDPFETTTSLRRVLVRGRELPLRSRQTLLFERYRSLGTVSRGWSTIAPRAEPAR
jgi:imidazolonepropionase-like amidohydrolase